MRSAAYSLLLSFVVLALKGGAYLATGSVALYSDALESTINVVAAAVALTALWIARKPADEDHPYGHQKAEYFSAVLEGVLIVLAAVAILYSAYHDWREPKPLQSLGKGLVISSVATVLNLVYGLFLVRTGRTSRSPALMADGKHLLSDVVSSLGVLLGVGLVVVTGWQAVDPIIAACVAIYILCMGWRLVFSSLNSLLDEAAPADVQAQIKKLVQAHAEGALEAHDFRTRTAGPLTFIEFHLIVPGSMTVEAAHAICDRLESSIEGVIPRCEVSIHVEPETKAKHQGIVVL